MRCRYGYRLSHKRGSTLVLEDVAIIEADGHGPGGVHLSPPRLGVGEASGERGGWPDTALCLARLQNG